MTDAPGPGPSPGSGGPLRLLPDDRLARRAARGDRRAFAAIYQRYQADLYRFCLAITGNGQGKGPGYVPADPTPGPKAGLPEKANAYGRYCQGENRKHVKGEKGTAFSRCVKAAAKLRRHRQETPGS